MAIIKDVDGNEHELRYTIGALKALQSKTGLKGLQPLMKRLQDVGDANDLGSMIWAGLLHENKDLTLEEAGDLIDKAGGIMEAVGSLIEAFGNAFPAAEDVKKK